ncbi:TonB-dependent receptor [Plebeiibacterium sediminum]|uniref:TonB-dependent receptor n=1 Tax=Plebeiibacterium sediminum TaxID=2992112 RepID=A0AAE3M967_9BACT|nr:TonB-dependent receptor [Plebeiobacterium sediminum]MCW3789237.1 TonB-dependent receptor [Plebeiobacterium sediminum]
MNNEIIFASYYEKIMNSKYPLISFVKYSIIIVFSFIKSYYSYSQQNNDIKLNINVEQASPQNVFNLIEQQSEYRFIYDDLAIDSLHQVLNLHLTETSLGNTLKEIRKQSTLKFQIFNQSIAVSIRKNPLNKINISGFITDSITGEYLIGAVIFMMGTNVGATTNQYGYYSLNVPSHSVTLKTQYLGYKSTDINIDQDEDFHLNIKLPEQETLLNEVIVSTTTNPDSINNNVEGANTISLNDINSLPLTYSEPDIIKSSFYLPGILRINLGSTGFSVRGGSSGENMVLFDHCPMYNISHHLADVSIFNPDIIQDMSIYKSGIPAQFGGGSSSVLNITSKNGDKSKFHLNGGISTVATRLAAEGPIIKNKLSYLVSLRRSNMEWKRLNDRTIKSWNFSDFNTKLHYKINDQQQLALSLYYGRDYKKYNYKKIYDFYKEHNYAREYMNYNNREYSWYTFGSSLSWVNNFNQNWLVNTSFFFSAYNYNWDMENEDYYYIKGTNLDIGFNHDYQYQINNNQSLKFGCKTVLHEFNTNDTFTLKKGIDDSSESFESIIYIDHHLKIDQNLGINYGLRGTFYFSQEASPEIDKINNNVLGITYYNHGSLEPRFAMSYRIKHNHIKLSYNHMEQNMHQISYVGYYSSSFFIWAPSTSYNKPVISDQVSLGLFHNKQTSDFTYSVEAYYKKSQNNLSYFNNKSDENLTVNLWSSLVSSQGKSYGLEFYGRMNKEKVNASISYTLSRSLRQADNINMGEWYKSNYDRPHNLALNANYYINKNLHLNLSWLYSTGSPASLNYKSWPPLVFDINHINQYRLDNYHRLDVGLVYENQKKKDRRFHSVWSVNVYNVYNRINESVNEGINQYSEGGYNNTNLYSDYGIMPAISYKFSF